MSNIKSRKNLKNVESGIVKSGLLFGPFWPNYFAFEIVYQFAQKKKLPVSCGLFARFLIDSRNVRG